MAISIEQLALLLKVQSKGGLWDSVHPRREERRQQQGVGFFWILHWRTCGLEVNPNTLTMSLGTKKLSPENVKPIWELHKRGQSGFRTGRQSSTSPISFLSAITSGPAHIESFFFNNQMIQCDNDSPDRPGCLATGSETSVRGRM